MAATHTWPGAAPCNTTLQACIQGVALTGDRIEIATNTPIDESISIFNRGMEVVAANGFRPRLADGRNISITSAPTGGNHTVLLDGIRLRNGFVLADYQGINTANYTIQNMVLEAGVTGTGGYISGNVERSTLNLTLYNNRVDCSPGIVQDGVIGLTSAGSTTLNANLYNNKVSCSTQAVAAKNGILVDIGSDVPGVADATVKVHGNEVRAGTGFSSFNGISFRENALSASPATIQARLYNNVLIGNGFSSSNVAIKTLVRRGDMSLQVVNNTMTGWRGSLEASSSHSPGTGSQNIDGLVFNNVMVSRDPAFSLQPTTTASLTNDYNLVNAPIGSTVLGSNSITSPAGLVSESMPRLRFSSPAIDNGDPAALGLGLIFNGLPVTDADGLRRIKGVGSTVDIGAYEYGDTSFEHRVTGSAPGISRIYSPALDGVASAIPQASLLDLPGATNYFGPYGIYYVGSSWRLFDEADINLAPGTAFNVFAPASGSGVLRHVATPASILEHYTRVDDSGLNDKPELILLATQNWNPNSVYNPHPISVAFVAGFWFVDNNDHAAMPANAAFNLYWQQPSPNAFRVTASAANLFLGALRVNHPLLDGTPCARPQATRMTFGSSTRTKTATWEYSTVRGEWSLDDDGFINPMPLGTQFNIVVDPAQVALCTDRIFANDF